MRDLFLIRVLFALLAARCEIPHQAGVNYAKFLVLLF